ncbi:hypothetical protein AVL62_09660 [Serinicoccus chungangensis]|uniref:Smf/DprA SLOG domain-containing protein n=1 Tax=Serinicoccus chungangensis TaxID=767452 RepID=A0A0W8I1I2_9MICO|nr:DNA-processing protein DprA [Serinicoccus chungangensis]KUG51578.1 hypothetical protein AVL62_09660 [Serinicoccus chungangensis]
MRREDERRARILLSRLAEPYDERVQQVVAEHGVVETVGCAVRDGRAPGGADLGRLVARLARAEAVDDERIAGRLGARILVPGDPEWPDGLDQLEHPPWCLWATGPGDLAALADRSVAVVGARASTAYGDHVTAGLCVDLVARGFTVVSGAAFGIDATAHRATLAAEGSTVAVLAGGVDVPYPRANTGLIDRIRRTGVLVSETPPGGAPARMRFLARNRIIAGVARGTVVVEAGLRSGARSTLKHARELGRPVMAVPGSVESLMSQGTHAEIRLGAELVTDGAEVAELVGRIGDDLAPVKQGESRAADGLTEDLRRVWQWLRPRSSSAVDDVMARSGLTLRETLGALRELERAGLAEELLDGWQRRPVGAR